ncbi:HLA class II histocompatibility antigen, DR beta 4 chain [Ancistrocladus abbreviatus]
MYKTRLQEYCQSNNWNLPEYRTTKEGPDHCPHFNAIVNVNDLEFVSPQPCQSSKTAQNEAAKAAFDHFTGSSSPNVVLPRPASSGVLGITSKDSANSACFGKVTATTKQDERHEAMAHLYKNQLQIYAQKRNLPLPVYASESEGPPHACHFKSKVIVDGKTFESTEFFKTVKDAENSAARVAFISLSADDIQQDGLSFSKNLLQEYVQKVHSCLPIYNTIQSGGVSHLPSFVSTVEIRGETFQGEQAKTKKQAEIYAAKVAYNALKARECKSSINEEIVYSPESQSNKQATNLGGECKSSINEEIVYSPESQSNKQATNLGGEAVEATQLVSTVRTHGPSTHSEENIEPKDGSSSIPSTLPAATPAQFHCNSVAGSTGASSSKRTRKIMVSPRKGEYIPIPPDTTLFAANEQWVAVQKYITKEGQ